MTHLALENPDTAGAAWEFGETVDDLLVAEEAGRPARPDLQEVGLPDVHDV
ncbi:hypothetical protein ABZ471_34040 [Streptomyces sp. NPDC005728]|uniref:hypothetical protein n=1 Tax=Streptomyces sp. NPDC005728 TaxID=3157054 RepID=UPI0033F64C3E